MTDRDPRLTQQLVKLQTDAYAKGFADALAMVIAAFGAMRSRGAAFTWESAIDCAEAARYAAEEPRSEVKRGEPTK